MIEGAWSREVEREREVVEEEERCSGAWLGEICWKVPSLTATYAKNEDDSIIERLSRKSRTRVSHVL